MSTKKFEIAAIFASVVIGLTFSIITSSWQDRNNEEGEDKKRECFCNDDFICLYCTEDMHARSSNGVAGYMFQ